MKKYVSEYGEVMLQSVIVLAVAILMFAGASDEKGNRGIFKELAGNVQIAEMGATEFAGMEAVRLVSGLEKPELTAENGRSLKTGVSYSLEQYLWAEDRNNHTKCICRLNKIRDVENDVDITEEIYAKNTGEICFADPGIYEFTVTAIDSNQRRVKAKFNFCVNRG